MNLYLSTVGVLYLDSKNIALIANFLLEITLDSIPPSFACIVKPVMSQNSIELSPENVSNLDTIKRLLLSYFFKL